MLGYNALQESSTRDFKTEVQFKTQAHTTSRTIHCDQLCALIHVTDKEPKDFQNVKEYTRSRQQKQLLNQQITCDRL